MVFLAQLWRMYWPVICLRRSPANTSDNPVILGLSALLFASSLLLQWFWLRPITKVNTFEAEILLIIEIIALYAIYTYTLLYLKGYSPRFRKTLSSVYVGQAFLHTLGVVLLLFSGLSLQYFSPESLAQISLMLSLIGSFILTIWQFSYMVFVFRNALDVDILYGILAALGLIAATILLASLG